MLSARAHRAGLAVVHGPGVAWRGMMSAHVTFPMPCRRRLRRSRPKNTGEGGMGALPGIAVQAKHARRVMYVCGRPCTHATALASFGPVPVAYTYVVHICPL